MSDALGNAMMSEPRAHAARAAIERLAAQAIGPFESYELCGIISRKTKVHPSRALRKEGSP